MPRDPVPSDIEKEIRQGRIAPFYLFYGPNEFEVERALERLKEIIPESARPFNMEVFYGGECGPSEVVNRARSVPFLAGRRLIIVRRCDDIAAEALDHFLPYLAAPVESTCLVLVWAKPDFRKELFRVFRAAGRALRFEELREHQVVQWVVRTAAEMGFGIEPEAALFLQQAVGNDPRDLHSELEKVYIRYGGGSVGLEQCGETVSRHRSFTIFELVDRFSRKECGSALVALNRFLEEEDKRSGPLRLVGMLNRELRLLLQAGEVLERGGKRSEMENALGQARHRAGEYMAQARGWSLGELKKGLAMLYEADGQLKTGSAPRLVLENVLLGLCGRSGRG